MKNVAVKKIIKNIAPYGVIKKYQERNKREEYYEPVPQRELYNSRGEIIHTYFLRDHLCLCHPWGFAFGRTPRTILWDRFHPGLETHFYTSSDILHTIGKPRKKFAYLIESEIVVPEDYKMFDQNAGLNKEFDLIFTYSERILNQYSNARFLPAAGVWYGSENSGVSLDEKRYEKKNKNISIIASNKHLCEMHKFRQEVALQLKKSGLADTFGAFDGGKWLEFIDPTLSDYRYQIVIENAVTDYYFTEKILNCFASMTIPIYIGAKKIGDFFNVDGIVQVKTPTYENVLMAMKECTQTYYREHIPAVLDNYKRVQEFLCIEDYLMKHYGNFLE